MDSNRQFRFLRGLGGSDMGLQPFRPPMICRPRVTNAKWSTYISKSLRGIRGNSPKLAKSKLVGPCDLRLLKHIFVKFIFFSIDNEFQSIKDVKLRSRVRILAEADILDFIVDFISKIFFEFSIKSYKYCEIFSFRKTKCISVAW